MKKLYIIILVLLLSFGNIIPIQAKDSKVIKVGYPIQQGLTEKDEEGNYIGYTVDYLNEIKKYTGWSYEFVEVEGDLNKQLTTLLKMLEDGEIDIMGGMVYNDELAEIYDYPGYNYGVAYTTLAVRKDDGRWISDDFQHWNDIKVGAYSASSKRLKELEKFANVNGFTYEVVEKDNYEQLLSALQSGEIDAMLQVDISMDEDLRAIAKFSPVPYYFAISKGNQDLVREMNSALSNIASGNPYLQANLYEKYFNANDEFILSEENRKYIESLGTIKVLLMDGNAPIQYYEKEPKGIAVSYLEKIKEKTGLQYEIIVTQNEKECMNLIKNRKIDLILGVPSNSDIITELDLTMSLPYLDSYAILVSGNITDIDAVKEKKFNHNTESALKHLNKGKNIAGYLDSYCTNFYLQKSRLYKNIKMDMNESDKIQYYMGLVDKHKIYLLSIINAVINSVSEEQSQEIIYENTIVPIDYTLGELIRSFFWQINAIVLLFLFLGVLLYVRNMKIKTSMFNELVIQQKRVNELSKLMDECIFEYNYCDDTMKIQNNTVMFDKKHRIENYMEYEKHHFIREMIQKEEDGTKDFILEILGQKRWYRVILKVIKGKNGVSTYALGKIYDVNAEVTEHQDLIQRSKRDPLTNLLNRAGAEEEIQRMLNSGSIEGSLLLFDIDNFKSINDNLGHPEGDEVLKNIARLMEIFFEDSDIKCRLGGDEFLVFLNRAVDKEKLNLLLEQWIMKTQQELFNRYKELFVSVSIGATIVAKAGETYKNLYKEADVAMYRAKLNGKNGFFIYEKSDEI